MKKQEQDQAALKASVIEMGRLTESMVHGAVSVISDPSNDQAIQAVMRQEESLDQMQMDIDKEAVRQLTVYSPVAGDLRFVLSVSRITAELERIGDHAVNMCENLRLLVAKSNAVPIAGIRKMASIVCGMVSDSLIAFAQGDFSKARETIANDDLVDALNDQIIEELLNDEVVRKAVELGTADIASSMAQILIARSLERIADQTTNVSEEVVYMIQGEDIRHGA